MDKQSGGRILLKAASGVPMAQPFGSVRDLRGGVQARGKRQLGGVGGCWLSSLGLDLGRQHAIHESYPQPARAMSS